MGRPETPRAAVRDRGAECLCERLRRYRGGVIARFAEDTDASDARLGARAEIRRRDRDRDRSTVQQALTVIEPPAFGIARGRPGVDEFIERIDRHWSEGPRDPGEFLRGFLALVGSSIPAGEFTPELLQGARTLMVERSPAEAVFAFDDLARAPFPKLVVSGAHSPAFDAVCDVLEERLGAERAVLPGAGHSVQRLGKPFNHLLAGFVVRAAQD